MGIINKEIVIKTQGDKTFDYMCDPDHFHEWIDGYENGKFLTPHKTGMGSAFKWHATVGPLKVGSSELVVEWIPGKRVAYRGSMFGVAYLDR